MQDLQKGDVIVFNESDIREIVLARLEDLVWTQKLFPSGAKSCVSPATEIEDLIAWGFTKETNDQQG